MNNGYINLDINTEEAQFTCWNAPISLIRDFLDQTSSEGFARDFRQSYMAYMEVFDFTANETTSI